VTPNDPGDTDSGPNDLQNYPVLDKAVFGVNRAEGTVNTRANTDLSLEFYSNATCDATGHGEALTLHGATSVTADAGGDAEFSFTHGLAHLLVLPPRGLKQVVHRDRAVFRRGQGSATPADFLGRLEMADDVLVCRKKRLPAFLEIDPAPLPPDVANPERFAELLQKFTHCPDRIIRLARRRPPTHPL